MSMQSYTSDGKVNETDVMELLDKADLTYVQRNESNVVSERTQKIQYADSPSYAPGSGEIVVNFQTGEDFISFRDSTLRFLLAMTATSGAVLGANTFGGGSCLNLFQRVRLVSRSGTVISQIDNANLLNYFKLKYSHSHAWRTQQGAHMLGASYWDNGTEVKYTLPIVSDETREFIVPMGDLISACNIKELAPSQLCRGLRLEILLAPTSEAFVSVAGNTGVDSHAISGVQCNLDSYRLSSGAFNELNKMSASEGLFLQFVDYENSRFDKASGTLSSSFEMRKVVSMGTSAMAVNRLATAAASATADSLASIATTSASAYNFRIGSLYLPVTQVAGVKQHYAQASYCLGKTRTGVELGVGSEEFKTAAVACADISRYWLENSGIALNNSTSLTLAITVPTAASTIDIFLQHNRAIKIYLQNIIKAD